MATKLPVDIELNYRMLLSWQYDKIEFLGLPHLKDNRPLRLGEIFTPLRFKLSPADETTLFLPKLLKDHKHLVVLGDPGCGKSTLIKQVTHSFSASSPPGWTSHFGKLLPIPIILRDYRVGEWNNYEDMLRSFISKLDQSIRELVTVEWLTGYLEKGDAIVLLDGIDEIGSAEARQRLRDKVVFPLIGKFPDSYFILTSRIVGYDEIKFDGISSRELKPGDDWITSINVQLSFQRCYVAHFSDEDIEQFVTRWYAARESDAEIRREGVESLKRALAQNDRVRRLASNPSLLTLIALIHRVTAQLPSGRVKLYDKITEAYLETIEQFRGVGQFPATLEQKRRWLARIGWKMQSHRTEEAQGELLATRRAVHKWLVEAISEERENAETEAEKFLDYIARRSGLLIPRGVDVAGDDQFSFVHLTFQEYFAALHLRGMAWDFGEIVNHIQANLTKRYWHETILVLFELLADMRGSGDKLVKILIEKAEQPEEQQALAEIFSELLLDSENGLSPAAQQQAAEFARDQMGHWVEDSVIERLARLPAEKFNEWIEKPLIKRLKSDKSKTLTPEFFLVGDEFVTMWSQLVEDELINNRESETWQVNQLIPILLTGTGRPNIIQLAIQHLPLHIWLSPIWNGVLRTFWFDDQKIKVSSISIAELNLNVICSLTRLSSKHYSLTASALVIATTGIQTLRTATMYHLREWYFQRFLGTDKSLDESLYQLQNMVYRAMERYFDPYLNRYVDKFWCSALDTNAHVPITETLGQNLKAAFSSSRLDIRAEKGSGFYDLLLSTIADAEWIAFQPEREDERLKTIKQVQPYLNAKDDWTRLLAINNLITLSAGTPELVEERNRLCDLAMQLPDKFTFPDELVEATKDKEWFNLPEIIAIIFLHKPGDPFLKPEWFDPKREESKFFLSPPREFFALAAEVLDPEGKTELAKWR